MAFEKWEKRTELYKNCDKKKYCSCLNFPEATILACMRVCGCPCYHQTGALFGTQVPGKNMQIMMTTIIPCTFNMVTHTEFQIKTANICFHFFCTKYKNYNVSSFWASQKLRSNVSKTGFDLGIFSELRFENWVLRLKFWGTVNLLFSSTALYSHLWQQKTALWLQGHICLRKISAAKQTLKLN